MDVLTDVLQNMRLQSIVYGRMELSAPWGLEFPSRDAHLQFFVISRGSCYLQLGAGKPLQLSAGDFVFLPRGSRHSLKSDPQSPVLPAEKILSFCGEWKGKGIFRHGGKGAETALLGGFFSFDQGSFEPLMQSLPEVLHVKADSASAPWLEAVRKLVMIETSEEQPGARIVVSRLADVLFIQAVRAYLGQCSSQQGGWLRALSDPKIGTALSKIHEAPQQDWTVESLAAAAAMSRSAFAAQFNALVGEPPLSYLSRWRMGRAAAMLKSGQSSIDEVAKSSGYRSAAAFSKAFKRLQGAAPGAFKRKNHEV